MLRTTPGKSNSMSLCVNQANSPHFYWLSTTCGLSRAKWWQIKVANPHPIRTLERPEIKLRAERKAGEILGEIVQQGRPSKTFHDGRFLPEGITYKQSHRWQLQALIPEEVFERGVITRYSPPQRRLQCLTINPPSQMYFN